MKCNYNKALLYAEKCTPPKNFSFLGERFPSTFEM